MTSPTAAIVGATECGIDSPGSPALDLLARASVDALAAAGLTLADVDGLCTTGTVSRFNGAIVADYLGIQPRWASTGLEGGSSFEFFLGDAVDTIASGRAETVLICYGSAQRSASARGLSSAVPELQAPITRYELPFEPMLPIAAYALMAQRHMHEFATPPEALAEVAIAAREWALRNPAAFRHGHGPLSVDDVFASPLLSTPLHKLDCCLVTDGAAAVVVTAADRARDLVDDPVVVLGTGSAISHRNAAATLETARAGAARSGADALARAGVGVDGLDVVELYDSFTITVLLTLEALGFCGIGESGEWVADGKLRPGGSRPINTNGGGLSHSHAGMYGLFLVVEAVRQLQGQAGERQLPSPETALCHGTGGYLNTHATVVLGVDR